MKLVYFAWIRERIGKAEEELDLPTEIITIADLINWLKSRGDEYDYAFAQQETVRVALDQFHAEQSDAIGNAREIAFFPPMTGG